MRRATGGDPTLTRDDESEPRGVLGHVACSVLMKLLYGARVARWDLLKAVTRSAARVSKWSKHNDLELHRLMCYVDLTVDLVLRGWVWGDRSDVDIDLFGDADFAGDRPSYKSTSGMVTYALGPRTSFPIAAKRVKQTCRSHSTPEADIVAMHAALRTIGLPAFDLWDTILGRKATAHFQSIN